MGISDDVIGDVIGRVIGVIKCKVAQDEQVSTYSHTRSSAACVKVGGRTVVSSRLDGQSRKDACLTAAESRRGSSIASLLECLIEC